MHFFLAGWLLPACPRAIVGASGVLEVDLVFHRTKHMRTPSGSLLSLPSRMPSAPDTSTRKLVQPRPLLCT
ncbi:hypothetical protein EYZ11_010958 [Aspergillus tanneri]|uniref:Secreted protein n=1 Tax=Aspergillus tanneri TaxID=1220188 RepID=A0A4V3UN28_9EURO|nr:hypothetical protein EYZ11_010958 [Aspergillus tanneri]